MSTDPFTAQDLEELDARGITVEEAHRQLALLRDSEHFVRLVRPCVPGDGIRRVAPDEAGRLQELAVQAVSAGRAMKFVPASGAASRMFRDLQHFYALPVQPGHARVIVEAEEGGKEARVLLDFLEGAGRLPFAGTLRKLLPAAGDPLETLARQGQYGPILTALLSPRGMDAGNRPKGLLEFHRYGDLTRTAFEEQLRETVALVRDRDGVARAHFTVSADHEAEFRAELDRAREAVEVDDARLEVSFSVQKASTDTIASDLDRGPFRLDGHLLFRPAGHGALIENLSDLGADLVLVKNIDNVAPERVRAVRFEWTRVLLGLLVDVQARAFEHIHALEAGAGASAVDAALAFLREVLDDELPPGVTELEARRRGALQMLDRPMRVCGMVPNTGEPGGAPFFIQQADGSPGQQIVEMGQIDLGDPEQADMVKRSTHFNPVFLACGVRNHRGEPFDLRRFVDPRSVIVTRKSAGGRELNALERPGLWNGAMAHWSTIFVETPLDIFTPVKTVLDLLRPEHQPAEAEA